MALIAKLPLEFKSLRMSVHRNFDELALEAETMGDGALFWVSLAQFLTHAPPVTQITNSLISPIHLSQPLWSAKGVTGAGCRVYFHSIGRYAFVFVIES
jgi:hypothetical protein